MSCRILRRTPCLIRLATVCKNCLISFTRSRKRRFQNCVNWRPGTPKCSACGTGSSAPFDGVPPLTGTKLLRSASSCFARSRAIFLPAPLSRTCCSTKGAWKMLPNSCWTAMWFPSFGKHILRRVFSPGCRPPSGSSRSWSLPKFRKARRLHPLRFAARKSTGGSTTSCGNAPGSRWIGMRRPPGPV